MLAFTLGGKVTENYAFAKCWGRDSVYHFGRDRAQFCFRKNYVCISLKLEKLFSWVGKGGVRDSTSLKC